MKGVALKVTYNDGGGNGSLFGFNGVCSNRNMWVNVRERKMTNCSDPDNPCRAFVDGNFEGRRPTTGNCYESHIFEKKRFEFGCGFYHHGPSAGEPIPVKNVSAGDIAFLTTMLPGKEQHERIIFGCYRVREEPRFKDRWGYMIKSDGAMDIRLPDEVAIQTNFWRYFKNKDGSRKWATGLFRYLSETQTQELLGDLVGLLGDHLERDVLLNALGKDVPVRPLRRLPVTGTNSLGGGGYAGGESEAHRNLKEYVAAHPETIGLPRGSRAEIEFPYLSGDQVDVKFDLPDGTFAIVEVETICPLPGAHQCIKYRALLEAAYDHGLGSGKVQAVLVAHGFDKDTTTFAAKYGIKLVQLKV